MKISKIFILLTTILVIGGCAGFQKSIDKKIIKSAIGKKYNDVIGDTSWFFARFHYGSLLTSEKLPDGSVLYVHVFDYESSRTTILGFFGDVEHSYRINGFKVKDSIIIDWVYGLYVPGNKYTHIFGFVLGYDANVILYKIKNEYESMIKTSTDEEISSWR